MEQGRKLAAQEDTEEKTPYVENFREGLCAGVFALLSPIGPLWLFWFVEEQTRESLGGLLLFDVTTMITAMEQERHDSLKT